MVYPKEIFALLSKNRKARYRNMEKTGIEHITTVGGAPDPALPVLSEVEGSLSKGAVPPSPPDPVPVSAQAIPFWELLETGKVPDQYLKTEYVTQQFVERLVHYVLSIPSKSISIPQLSAILEQIDARQQIFFFKRLKETSPHSLKEFAPLYYGFMAEFYPLLFT